MSTDFSFIYTPTNIFEFHQDQVLRLPGAVAGGRVDLLASSPRCPVEMYSVTADGADVPHVVCVQGHPEFSAPLVAGLLEVAHAAGAVPADALREAAGRRGEDARKDGFQAPSPWIKDPLEGVLDA